MIGKYVLIRTYSAGVHIGVLLSHNGKEATLTDSRRIWSWQGAFTLSEISQRGVGAGSRLSLAVPAIVLTEVIEVIPCSAEAEAQLRAEKAYEPR
jgi:hypothetical protein